MKILLAEDQVMVRTALASLLRMETDMQVTEAVDGTAALQQLKHSIFDLLLTDIEMPGATGIELAQYVQHHKLATKVVIITTFGRAGYVKRAMNAGIGGFRSYRANIVNKRLCECGYFPVTR